MKSTAICLWTALTVAAAGAVTAQETIYFADSLNFRGKSLLATVELDGPCEGQITPLPVGPAGDGLVDYDLVDAIAVDPTGQRLYLFDADFMACVDLGDGSITDVGLVVPDCGGPNLAIDQAAFSPDGTLYVTSTVHDRMYSVDTGDATAQCIGLVTWEVDGSTVSVQGADIAFASDGTLFLYTNKGPMATTPAPRGLYRLDLPATAGPVPATWMGADGLGLVTGMAIRDDGLGDIVVSDALAGIDEFVVLDRATGDEVDRYPMSDAACGTYDQVLGDLSNGPLAPAECFLVIGDAPGDAGFLAIDHLFQTQVGPDVEDSYAVLMSSTPEFVLPTPQPAVGLGGVGSKRGALPDGATPAWMLDGHFAVQVLMWNPSVFPGLPEQCTVGLYVTVQADGSVLAAPYGASVGDMQIWHEIDVDAQGQKVIRFPFSVRGM